MLQGGCREAARRLQGGCRKAAERLQGCREAAKRLQGRCREAAERLQGGCREAAGLQGGCREAAERLQGGCRDAAGRLQGGCKEAAHVSLMMFAGFRVSVPFSCAVGRISLDFLRIFVGRSLDVHWIFDCRWIDSLTDFRWMFIGFSASIDFLWILIGSSRGVRWTVDFHRIRWIFV